MLNFSVFLFLFFACSISYCQTDTTFITDDIPILKVKENEPFVLKFLACHSCGYHWSLSQADSSYVKLINVTSKHTSGRNDVTGGNVFEFWQFKVTATGNYTLEFVYKRSWLKETEKVFRVGLYVK